MTRKLRLRKIHKNDNIIIDLNDSCYSHPLDFQSNLISEFVNNFDLNIIFLGTLKNNIIYEF